MTQHFNPRSITHAALRNRVRAQLNAAPKTVWELLGDLARFPEFSSGLDRVEVVGSKDRPMEYTCHFKPMAEGEEPLSSREVIHWWHPGAGYASSSASGDVFGLQNDVNLVAIAPSAGGSVVTWEEYFDAADVEMMQGHFAAALADIAQNLVSRFGGEILEQHP